MEINYISLFVDLLFTYQEPLWENKCIRENCSFSNITQMSKHIKKNGNWLYFDYKYIGEKVDEKIFQVVFTLYA